MQVTNNINSLNSLDKQFEKTINNIRRLTQDNGGKQFNTKDQKNLKDNQDQKQTDTDLKDTSLVEEIVEEEVSIPLAYTANAQVITMQNETQRTILDIKV